MAQTTSCPACGAPLDYSGEHDVVHCTFCETDIEVYDEDGETRFRVLAHPDIEIENQSELTERVDLWNPDQGPQPQVPDEPVAPGYATTGASMADPDALSPEAVLSRGPVNTEPIPDVQAHYTLRRDEPAGPGAGSGSTARWVGIGIAVFVVLCIACACVAAIAVGAGLVNFNV